MLPDDHPDPNRLRHHRLNNAGLILPATLALAYPASRLGDAPGRAHPGDKVMTLVASALAGGDCIRCRRVARRLARSAARSRRHPPWGPSCAASGGATSASWRVSRELLARRRAIHH